MCWGLQIGFKKAEREREREMKKNLILLYWIFHSYINERILEIHWLWVFYLMYILFDFWNESILIVDITTAEISHDLFNLSLQCQIRISFIEWKVNICEVKWGSWK